MTTNTIGTQSEHWYANVYSDSEHLECSLSLVHKDSECEILEFVVKDKTHLSSNQLDILLALLENTEKLQVYRGALKENDANSVWAHIDLENPVS